MIYQEINLPIWGQLVLMGFWLLALVLLLYIKPREDVKQETKETTHRPRQRAIRGLHSNCMANVTIKEV